MMNSGFLVNFDEYVYDINKQPSFFFELVIVNTNPTTVITD